MPIYSKNVPSTLDNLVEYAKRRLGAPILNIDVTEDQINDLLNDAIQYFQEYATNGSERTFLAYRLTKEDIERFRSTDYTSVDTEFIDDDVTKNEYEVIERADTGTIDVTEGADSTQGVWKENTNYIALPDFIFGVSRVFGQVGSTIRNSLLGIQFQIFLSDIYNFGSLDILQYYTVKSYLETLNFVLNNGNTMQYRYNQRQGRLYLDSDLNLLSPNTWLLIECFKFLDPDEAPMMFNDIFLKRYFTALLKRQWGMNLSKYTNVQLPGGVLTNGMQIYEQGNAEAIQLEADIFSKYSLPPKLIIG